MDASQSTVEQAPFLGWKDLDLGALVREIFPEVGIVAIENDAKASAVAELFFGRHKSPLGSFVFLSVSKGKVFNLLGREVATLVNQIMAPGSYTVDFNAAHLASGMYVYRLKADNFVSTYKMVLMK